MTVRELIEELEQQDPDKEVLFAYPARDYIRSILAGEIKRVEESPVRYTEYHNKHKVINEDEFDEDKGDGWVVLLS